MTYLIVGLDQRTLGPWHRNVVARDVASAKRIARAAARSRGIELVVAAVIGPNSDILREE